MLKYGGLPHPGLWGTEWRKGGREKVVANNTEVDLG